MLFCFKPWYFCLFWFIVITFMLQLLLLLFFLLGFLVDKFHEICHSVGLAAHHGDLITFSHCHLRIYFFFLVNVLPWHSVLTTFGSHIWPHWSIVTLVKMRIDQAFLHFILQIILIFPEWHWIYRLMKRSLNAWCILYLRQLRPSNLFLSYQVLSVTFI